MLYTMKKKELLFIKFTGFILLIMGLIAFSSCENDDPLHDDPGKEEPTPEPIPDPISMAIDVTFAHTVDLTENADGSYTMVATNADPVVFTKGFEADLDEKFCVFEFEYKSTVDLNNLQFFFVHDKSIDIAHSGNYGAVPRAAEWTTYKVILKNERKNFDWGKQKDRLRIDLGDNAGPVIDMRNLKMRVMTSEEIEAEHDNNANSREGYEQLVKDYLSEDFSNEVDRVNVTTDKVTVSGSFAGSGNFYLVEVPPYVDLFKIKKVDPAYAIPLEQSSFSVSVDRNVVREGYNYDRLLSRWAIFKEGDTVDELVSHARYADPDDIVIKQSVPAVTPAGKKGLGGIIVRPNDLLASDIRNLGLTSATINICPMQFMHSTRQAGDIVHLYNGKEYYFNEPIMEAQLDGALRVAAEHNVVVAGILLFQPVGTANTEDAITNIFQHPDYQSVGTYTMPNMTTVESTEYYAAVLDFLAQRYSKESGPRIAHWILHNEIDGAVNWVNMGNDVLPATFMETFMRSARMCYNIVHQYDQNSRVYVPFTHGWAAVAGPGWYIVKDLLDYLNQYSRAEGDFYWAPACHSYPSSLTTPMAWIDEYATFRMQSAFVTLKNLEVLNKWVNTSANQYRGNIKRLVWLSECGTGSSLNSANKEQDFINQAAGFAYAWKKISALDGIEGIQWHNWQDTPLDGGLLGLRDENGNPKPVYEVYKNAETENEDEYFSQFLSVIGIPDWNIIQNVSD